MPPALGVELPFTERLLRASSVLRAVAGLGFKPTQLVLDLLVGDVVEIF